MAAKKLIVLAACVAAALAQYAAPAYYYPKVYAAPEEPAYPPVPYSFEYSVDDPSTYDVKSQSEHSDGKTVRGFYSLLEADGTKRTVEYIADEHGFNAEVKKEGNPSYASAYNPAYRPSPY